MPVSKHSSVRGLSAADYAVAKAAALRYVAPVVIPPAKDVTDMTPEEHAAAQPKHVGTMTQAEYNIARSTAMRRK